MQTATIVNLGFKEEGLKALNVIGADVGLPPIGPIKPEETTKFSQLTNVKLVT